MIFGVSPTQDAVVVARTMSSGETFAITSITSIQFQARSGDDLTALRHRLISIFDRAGRSRGSKVALLGSSSGRFKSSVEAIKAEAITELVAAERGLHYGPFPAWLVPGRLCSSSWSCLPPSSFSMFSPGLSIRPTYAGHSLCRT